MARAKRLSSFVMDESIIIACLIGLNLMTGLLIYESMNDHFSSVYLVPETLDTYPVASTTSFTYGITSHEREEILYYTDIFAGTDFLGRKTITLMPGETHREQQMIDLSLLRSSPPFLVSVQVSTPDREYEVHYWIRNRTLT